MSPLGHLLDLSVDFTHVKKIKQRFSAIYILNFDPKIGRKV